MLFAVENAILRAKEDDYESVAQKRPCSVMDCGNNLLLGVHNLHSLGILLTEIATMASANPAKAVGIFEKTGSIAVGKAADLALPEDAPIDLTDRIEGLRSTRGKKFFDPARQDVFPESDFHYCVDSDKFDFVLRVEKNADGLMAVKKTV